MVPVLTYDAKEYTGMILVHQSDIAQFRKENLPEDVCSCAGGKMNGGTVGGTWARRNSVNNLLENISNKTDLTRLFCLRARAFLLFIKVKERLKRHLSLLSLITLSGASIHV